jgi:hypothetical protein
MNRVAGLVVAVLVLGCASSAHAAGVTWIPGYAAPGTPKKLDRV